MCLCTFKIGALVDDIDVSAFAVVHVWYSITQLADDTAEVIVWVIRVIRVIRVISVIRVIRVILIFSLFLVVV